jgi:putative tricarboxylic transport membrane protein
MRLPTPLKLLFERPRPAGDLAFALAFLALAVFLASQLGVETKWFKRTKLFAQPAFWPAVGIFGMVFFGAFHVFGAVISKRTPGRMAEAVLWLRSIEYALWFMAYVLITPWLGYLPSTILFALALTFRTGLRGRIYLLAAGGMGLFIVVLFKSFLQVKIPGGILYEYLPDALRNFMILNF